MPNGTNTIPPHTPDDEVIACIELQRGIVSILRGLIQKKKNEKKDKVLKEMIQNAKNRLIVDGRPQAAAYLEYLFKDDFA